MVRIKRGNVARKRRKRVLKLAKGYKGAHSRLFKHDGLVQAQKDLGHRQRQLDPAQQLPAGAARHNPGLDHLRIDLPDSMTSKYLNALKVLYCIKS